jgi:hypothetical protein
MQKLTFWEILSFCEEKILPKHNIWQWEKSHTLVQIQENEITKRIQLPFLFPELSKENWVNELQDFLENSPNSPPDYLILLIQAGGNAGLAHTEEGEIVSHKIIRRYTVRQKQGKSQLKHLNSKGKSKLGSRIRLAQTKDFFEEINKKLQEWELENIPLIFYSATPDVMHAVFEAKNQPPFQKKDERLQKLPLDMPLPTMEEVLQTKSFLQDGILEEL